MTDQTNNSFDHDFDAIAKAQASGLKGAFPRLGTQLVMLESTLFFKSKVNQASTVVIRGTLKDTLVQGCYDGKLTPEEAQAGKLPNGLDDAHHPGELLVAIYKVKNGDKDSLDRFNGNVKGFMEAAKSSLHNFIDAALKVAKSCEKLSPGADEEEKDAASSAAAEYRSYAESEHTRFSSLGIDLSDEAKGKISNAEMRVALVNNGFQGIYVKMVVSRYENKAKQRINITGFQALTIDEWVKIINE